MSYRRPALSARRPMRPAMRPRRVVAPQCNTATNVEGLPLEAIPVSGALPKEWSLPGVYGVYDVGGALQYVAAVDDVRSALEQHRAVLCDPQRVHSVRMVTVPSTDDAPLGELAENWVMTHTKSAGAPPGNCDLAPEWLVETSEETGPDISFAEGSEDEDAETEIMRILRQNRLVLFMKGTTEQPMCGFSRSTLMILQGIAGKELKVVDCLDSMRNPGLRQGIKDFSEWPTIPQFYVNGDFVGGCDIVQSMAASGELHALIEPVLAEAPTYFGS